LAAFDEVTQSPQIRTTTAPCQLHQARHIPTSHVNHRHHIWPLGEGGPDIEDNIVVACPTGHYNTHLLYNEFKLYEGDVPYKVLRRYSQGEREYAELGYKRYARKAI
jgi:hypothetical protein